MANQKALERLGELSGVHLAVAVGGWSPPDTLLPLGFLEKRNWWSGTTLEFRRFVLGSDEYEVDFGVSAGAALQWLEMQALRKWVSAVIVDGYFRRDEERRESLVQRMISIKDKISTEVFFPYKRAEDGVIEFDEPICFVYDIVPVKESVLADVDAKGFIDAIKQGFRSSGILHPGILLWDSTEGRSPR